MERKEPRLREQVRHVIRVNRYSIRTEKSYWYWIRYFIRFHRMKHPRDMGPQEVNQFLTWLAVHRNVAAATQDQALNSLVFLYDKVLDLPLGDLGGVVRSKKPRKLPVVLTHEEAIRIINGLSGDHRLIASLLYGAGLRVTEACRLRIKDLDFEQKVVTVRDGKGAKDRTTLMPATLVVELHEHVSTISKAWKDKSTAFVHPVSLPFALARKCPRAGYALEWQWLFPSSNLSTDNLGNITRHHRHITSVQRAVRQAVRSAGINKRAGCHTFRHTFATELLKHGTDIRTVQDLIVSRLVNSLTYCVMLGPLAKAPGRRCGGSTSRAGNTGQRPQHRALREPLRGLIAALH